MANAARRRRDAGVERRRGVWCLAASVTGRQATKNSFIKIKTAVNGDASKDEIDIQADHTFGGFIVRDNKFVLLF